MTKRKPILCLDFDGVLHSYSSGWRGADVVSDPPTPGAIDFLSRAVDQFKVAIYSSRSNTPGGVAAMGEWLFTHLVQHFLGDKVQAGEIMAQIDFPTEKPPALVTLDDRAVTFTGTWPGLDELRAFQPWNKRPEANRQIEAETLIVPCEPTEAMLEAARDWSYAKYGKPIGNDAARGCWAAMLAAVPQA